MNVERPIPEQGSSEPEKYSSTTGFIHYMDYEVAESLVTRIDAVLESGVDRIDIDTKLEFVTIAANVIGNFDHWIKMQIEQGYLYERRLAFIKDTIKFLETGYREVSVSNWKSLLEYYPNSNKSLTNKENRQPLIRDRQFLEKSDIVVLWCSKPNGFEDMLWTLSLILRSEVDNLHEPLNSSSFSNKMVF